MHEGYPVGRWLCWTTAGRVERTFGIDDVEGDRFPLLRAGAGSLRVRAVVGFLGLDDLRLRAVRDEARPRPRPGRHRQRLISSR